MWPLPGDPDDKVGTQQHIVPQLHLHYFANTRNQIAVVDRRTGHRFLAPTTRPGSAVERDFNTFVNIDGQLDGSLDHLLTYIEGRAAPVIKKMVEGSAFTKFPPSEQDRDDLCIFLAFQMTRGRKVRRRTEMLADLYAHVMIPANMTPVEAEALLVAKNIEPTAEAINELVSMSMEMERYEFVADPNAHLALMGPLAKEMYQQLATRRWYLAEFDTPSLVTCDEPVVLSFEDDNPQRGGLLNADEVWFPLSPKHLLTLTRYAVPDLPEGRFKVPVKTAVEVNKAIVANAYSEIYLHPDQHHLDDLTLSDPAPLFHINASPEFNLARFNKPPTISTQRRRPSSARQST